MSKLFDLFQQAIITSNQNYDELILTIKKHRQTLYDLELSRSDSLLRLGLALQQWNEKKVDNFEIAPLIRQVIRHYQQRLLVSVHLWNAICTDNTNIGLRVLASDENDLVELTADNWQPGWLAYTTQVDALQARRYDERVVGDGLLFAMSSGGFTHYQSLAQKVAVQACFFSPPGTTLLVALPTGAGKSLAIQLPAWYESRGGTIRGGTTIVVVPTVSLAMDQERRIRQFFSSSVAPEYEPYCWTANTPSETKTIIREGILYGTLPVLYVSPESLLDSSLHDICLEAAKNGTLRRFVIDEAHLIETWGAGFRTDFQFLAAYQKLLLEYSKGQLRTLLLSATISHSCADLLKRLFSDGDHYYTIRANRLRSEPAYWFYFSFYKYIREQRILEALQWVPRPLILYVLTPDDAEYWGKLLKTYKFTRYAIFSGDTDASKREQLIASWNNDEIDIMIATSAFGVGIDKSNVRTILHACLPENLDRFYQEVGRAGRDGYSATSLVFTTFDDNIAAFNMTRTALITTEKATKRWEGMRKTAIFPVKGVTDILQVDTNAPPEGSPNMRRSRANKEWNEHTLLLMQRADLLQIIDTRERILTVDNGPDMRGWLQIRLLNPIVTAYPEEPAFQNRVEEVRSKEIAKIQQALKDTEELVKNYGSSHATECLAHRFMNLYPNCSRACGGCSYCWQHNIKPYEQSLPLDIDLEPGFVSTSFLNGDLRELMGWRLALNVAWDGVCNITTLAQYNHVLASLAHMGIQQILLPSELLNLPGWIRTFIEHVATSVAIPHTILSLDDIVKHSQIPLYLIPTAIIYPVDDEEADEIYCAIRRQIHQWQQKRVPIIHIVHRSLMLSSERGRFLDRMDGTTEEMTHLQSLLEKWQTPISF